MTKGKTYRVFGAQQDARNNQQFIGKVLRLLKDNKEKKGKKDEGEKDE